MILLVKKKNNYIRRYEKDIWGLCYEDEYGNEYDYWLSWYLLFFFKIFLRKLANMWKKYRRFVYRIDKIEFRFKRKKRNKRWLSLKITRLYFLIIQDHQFRLLFKKANKLDGNLESNYCYFLECRLFPFIYRMNFSRNLFIALEYSKVGYLYINKKLLKYPNALIPLNKIIYPRKKWRFIIKHYIIKKARIKAILFNIPRYIFVSWKFFYLYMLRKPRKKDIVYPISLDIQRITGYY